MISGKSSNYGEIIVRSYIPSPRLIEAVISEKSGYEPVVSPNYALFVDYLWHRANDEISDCRPVYF